jgi:hypothetical protein
MRLFQTSRLLRLGLLVSILGSSLSEAASDYLASISAHDDVPQWASDNSMQLELSTQHGEWIPVQYTVIPLTENIGLNESARDRVIVKVKGILKLADSSNYHEINQDDDVAYLSCDDSEDDSFIDPNMMLDGIMKASPKAIVLYSTNKNWCSLDHGSDLPFTSIFTMADAAEASDALDYFNMTRPGEGLEVVLTGNTTSFNTTPDEGSGRGSSAAMSALYAITGLISVLFLLIIGVGAYRAHRYPERYGPRHAFGGRPRQSRAKGLARAVLDTIPIVKFGQNQQGKPDPELEMDASTTASREPGVSSRKSQDSLGRQVITATSLPGSRRTSLAMSESSIGSASVAPSHMVDEQPQCSICTEDFAVGEDVRVLPCSHQYHPTCVDPWLINVSGTCPLCRLDLRPNGAPPSDAEDSLPPPLAIDSDDAAMTSYRNRLSRIFDINRLRQATTEEQLEALRQMRTQGVEHEQHAEGPSGVDDPSITQITTVPDGEATRRRSGLTGRLRDAFRIRTRAQVEARSEADC